MTPLEKVKKLIEIKNEAYAQGVMDAYEVFTNGSRSDVMELEKILDRVGIKISVDTALEMMHRIKLREKL